MSANTQYENPAVAVDPAALSAVVEKLTGVNPPRNHRNINSLNRAAEYIAIQFSSYGYQPTTQKYAVGRREYKNILASYGPANAHRFLQKSQLPSNFRCN
ncbi:MAG: hypothetical protein GY697_27375 [Desulfobacterales bacterium]|nr:hypothetical protein [Desulfobacterales bacterium]